MKGLTDERSHRNGADGHRQGSYCETDRLSNTAWSLFGQLPKGWPLVTAICDYVHDRIAFGYQHASSTKTAWDAHNEGRGVCRDFAHLAITLCRCVNIPARYCTGYLGDIGVPLNPSPMDFSAWFEVYLGDRWYPLDARHNKPRIGRILMARGRDATDVAIVTHSDRASSRNSRYSLPRSRERLSPVRPLRDCLKLGTSG
jgi:transglutaminase-like putative cysteine protease